VKICVDLDGTICETKTKDQSYKDVKPLDGAVDTLEFLKQRGYYIVINTARNMRTCENNLGRVIANQGRIVIEWLDKYCIPYDELLFGKPHVDFFIDDKGIKFTNWKDVKNILLEEEENV
jgi:capsule biosynthesis phosphatase|tara:strand:+ start:136 stop:495 length:360 start_codon:yes stop_codon:yes gene_type:complete